MTDARPGVGFLENRRRETTMSDKKWIKAEDVARLAGVSALGGLPHLHPRRLGVGEDPAEGAERRGSHWAIRVNIIARTMITGSSNFIGIVTAGFDNPFRSKLLAPLVHQLALNGFMPLLMNADDPRAARPSLKQLLSLSRRRGDHHLRRAAAVAGGRVSGAQDPVTLINRHADLAGCDRVCSDNAQGAKLVADSIQSSRLAAKVGFIGENRENFSTRQRYDALSPGRRVWR